MTDIEEKKLVHAIFGIAQSVNGLLAPFKEMQLKRNDADERMIDLLKLISRKH